MIKVYYPSGRQTREYILIKQGLINNPRTELVDTPEESDFIFLFFTAFNKKFLELKIPYKKIVFIDFCDWPSRVYPIKCFAYFKRSWLGKANMGSYTGRKLISWPSHFHPLSMAIMDEFIVKEKLDRNVALSCTLRKKLYLKNPRGHLDRMRVLSLLETMDIQGKTQIGEFNFGGPGGSYIPNMMKYFKLMRRSKIVVNCSPSNWEGDVRIWEAFASGALVFSNKLYTPMPHPFINGKHCVFYELPSPSLGELREKILYFLEHTSEAKAIAKAGFDFAMKHHRVANRIDEILEVIT